MFHPHSRDASVHGTSALASGSMRVVPATHLLHVFPTFAVGGSQVRTATIIDLLGDEFRHTILPMDGRREALSRISTPVGYLDPPLSRHAVTRPLHLRRLLSGAEPDLVLTYNWGAIEAVLAARTLSIPVIHTEDGFGPDEAERLLPRRVWTRRLLLRSTSVRTVVPSRTLEQIALRNYRLPRSLVSYIPNGIDLKRFHPGRSPEIRAQLGIAEGEIVFGTMGALRPEKNLEFMLRAFAEAAIPNSRLVLVGSGPCSSTLEIAASKLGLGERVCFAGAIADPANYYRAFDVFAMSSVTEQMPLSLLEAMATGLPAVCTDAGDTAILLGSKKSPDVLQVDDLNGYVGAMRLLAENRTLRRNRGDNNRARCEAEYGVDEMVKKYRREYQSMLRRAV